MKRVGLAFTSLLCVVATGCARPTDKTDGSLPAVFEDVAFGRELGSERSAVLHKWTGPVRIATLGTWPVDPWATLDPHIEDLTELTGLLFSRAAPANANLRIHAAPSSTFPEAIARLGVPRGESSRILAKSTCFFIFEPDRTHAITRAEIFIDQALPAARVRHCLVEETTQALGLPNDIVSREPSLFDNAQVLARLSERDRLLLRILYHPALQPGMDRATARGLVEVLATYAGSAEPDR